LTWISHTYTHANLDSISYSEATTELQKNQQTRNNLGLGKYNRANLITPDISGLTNQQFLDAARDFGIRYVVSDTSVLNLPGGGYGGRHCHHHKRSLTRVDQTDDPEVPTNRSTTSRV
jgi:hypothetical protein